MASIIQHLSLRILGDFKNLENVSEMVAETSDASRDRQNESVTGENNRCTCTFSEKCCQWKQHVYMHLEHLLRYLRALSTIRVHPELDGRTLDIVHSLNRQIERQTDKQNM